MNTITPDGFRHEWSQRPRPKLHILQKKIRRAYLRDDQTSTGTNKQSLVIKPGYFRQGFDYIIQVRTKMKGKSYIFGITFDVCKSFIVSPTI